MALPKAEFRVGRGGADEVGLTPNEEVPTTDEAPSGSSIVIEVAYALPDRAVVKTFELQCPATVADALEAAAADPDFSGADPAHAPAGVFGTLARPEQLLTSGERVEIYRALSVDPKAARRARAKQARHGR